MIICAILCLRGILKDNYIQFIDGLPYKMNASFDFDFIHKYGRVLKVFDDQDSGNICFVVYKDVKNEIAKAQTGKREE